MVATIAIAKSVSTLAGLLSLLVSVSASPMDMTRREDAPAEIKSADFYHFKTIPPDPANGVSRDMAKEQALSLAKFEGNQEAKYFWFLEKHPELQNKGGPGRGCQVGLYYDNVLERIRKAIELDWNRNATDKVEDRWAVAGGITPWCSQEFSPQQNNQYKDDQLGFVLDHPPTKKRASAFAMLTDLQNEGQGQDDTVIANQINIIWSERALDWLDEIYPGSAEKFKAAVNAIYNPIINPYKYGKADPIWSKVKPDNIYKGQ